MTTNNDKLHSIEIFEGWLLIVFSEDPCCYPFQAFYPGGEKAHPQGKFFSVVRALQRGRKLITGAKL